MRTNTDIIGLVQIETSRVLPSEWELLKCMRLAALRDAPSAFGSNLADEIGRTDEGWRLRSSQASAGEDLATYFARLDGRTIGIVSGYRPEESRDEVELISMWTSPDARRFGAGHSMVDAVVHWATEVQAHSVGLWVMRGNPAAELLYESMGFREDSSYQARPSDPCADELRMSLHIGESELSRESRISPP